MSIFVAAFHFLGLGLSFSGVALRIQGIKHAYNTKDLKGVYLGDNIWGIAAILIIVSGLLRAFAGYEKGTEFYLQNKWFHMKLGLFLLIFAAEIYPMVKLIKWRIQRKQIYEESDQAVLQKILIASKVELLLLVGIVFLASTMARMI